VSDRAAIFWIRAISLAGAILAVVGSGITFAGGNAGLWWSGLGGFLTVLSVGFALFAWPVASQQPRNAVVWMLSAVGFLAGSYVAGKTAASLIADPVAVWDLVSVPADMQTGAAWIDVYTNAAATTAVFLWLTFGLLLFPDGRLPSSGWRWLGWVSGVANLVLFASTAWEYRPSNTLLTGLGLVFNIALFAAMLATALSLAALIGRYRKSGGTSRQQFKWIVWGASVFLPTLVASVMLGNTKYEGVATTAMMVGLAAFLVSYGIAIGKYRLYDIDVVISRTVVYGSLAVFITGVYVAAVVGIGSLLGGEAESSPWLSVGAIAVVAFAFEPLRERLQRLANRLVYGKRATPYEVLSDFSRKITAGGEELLEQVARSLAEGTTAAEAAVWVRRDGIVHRTAVWPLDDDRPSQPTATDIESIPDVDLTRSVAHDDEPLGALTLKAARGQNLLPSDERLLEQMASGMGLALRNARLGEDLREQVEALARSRQRLVTVQDETRRHLERQLHDGVQQRLVALKVKLSLARKKAEMAGIDKAAELLEHVAIDTDQAIESLRDFARGIYPPLLEAEGPAAALSSQVLKLPIEVTVHAAGIGRHSRPVEAAVYFCVLEALQNVVKHAGASSAHVAITQVGDVLRFEVSDDGKGFDAAAVPAGSGLANLSDRVDALDGSVEILSTPGQGATIRGSIPSRQLEMAT
jgi:signal transduction histidine kinase